MALGLPSLINVFSRTLPQKLEGITIRRTNSSYLPSIPHKFLKKILYSSANTAILRRLTVDEER